VPLAVDLIQGMYAKLDLNQNVMDQEERARVAASEYMLHGMSKDDLNAVIMDVFKKADADSSGTLTVAEFQACIREADIGLTRKEINVLMHSLDANMDGVIDYQEFAPLCFDLLVEILKDELLQAQRNPSELEVYLLNLFKGTDPAGAGKLKVHELRDALRNADMGLTRLQILTVTSAAVVDAEGGVAYSDFALKAAELLYGLLDPAVQREKMEAVTQMQQMYAESQVFQVIEAIAVELDPSGTGFVEVGAFKAALGQCSLGLSAMEVDTLVYGLVAAEPDGTLAYGPIVDYAFQVLVHLAQEREFARSRVEAP